MKKTLIMTIALLTALLLLSASALESGTALIWNDRVLRVTDVLDGDEVEPIGTQPAEGRYIHLVMTNEGEPMTWSLIREIKAVLRDTDGTEIPMNNLQGSFNGEYAISEIDNAEMMPEFTLQFDLPGDLSPYGLTLVIEGAKEYAAIPEALVGTWTGTGTPKNNGSPIDLEATVNADGSGEYTFRQAGYVESYPFTLSSADNSFTVSIPEDNYLGISECGGTYDFDGTSLTLDITTSFRAGGSYSYTAVCTKADDPE